MQIPARELLALLEVAIHQRIVELHHPVGNLAVRGRDRGEIRRFLRRREEAVGDRFAAPRWQVQRQALSAEALPDVGEHALEIRAARVDLVHDDQPAELALGRGRHDSLRHHLGAALRVHDDRRGLHGREHRERAADEIGITRRVEQVHLAARVVQMADVDV